MQIYRTEEMQRKLFCEINDTSYKLSIMKERIKRHILNTMTRNCYSKKLDDNNLKYCVYKHKSLIMRKLGNNDLVLQENKKVNLRLAAPKIDGILIEPGQTFSFWQLVKKCSKEKGYLDGVTISNGKVTPGTAGGMCQMTNLIHWMVLHSPLEITEHHHHHKYDIFPDYKRQIPFGTGTSIMFNYLDYRFKNNTKDTFQLNISVTDQYLQGELRVDKQQDRSYHIVERNSQFIKEGNDYYRCNEIYRKVIDKRTGNTLDDQLIIKNKSLVLYKCEEILINDKVG